MSTSTPTRVVPPGAVSPPLQGATVAVAALIAALYGLLFGGVLSIEGAADAERGILGVASVVFLVLAGLLWWRPGRLVWSVAAALQVLMGVMYLAVAPDRDPAFEVWGVTARALSLVLLAVLVALLVADRRVGTATGRWRG